ncbi:serine/threonine-protein kinase [Streptomyces halobius]|uniref:Serine/threonine protein kinase n=1 Tax=Streptomyces halobius TaxID=2879846 RepID=A0ABY4M9T6_9ACTN|nr:serine/threonine-protein kinase [Streptomyces halobius]UQA94512.1 serine/threonine protein kinase [Streptomyces halobius]
MEGLRGLTADDPPWIGDYRLLSRLGSGGMGRVYLARSEGGRTVAVKLVKAELAAEEEFRDRFRAEVAAARRVGGQWTAPVLDADTEADVPWVATGYIAGPALSAVVGGSYGRAGTYGALPEHSLRHLAYGLACALRDIHGVGLVHRDLKPSNVLLTIDGPRVIDFGIARALDAVGDQTQTRAGMVVGSPSFMSPEQVQGHRVGPASDVFCVGSVLAYAATGRTPFGSVASGVHAVMFRIAQDPPDLADAPEGIRGLIEGCLAKDPAARPAPEEVVGRIVDRFGPVNSGGSTAPWLPAELIASLGQHAVRLLDTDTPPGGHPPTAGRTGTTTLMARPNPSSPEAVSRETTPETPPTPPSKSSNKPQTTPSHPPAHASPSPAGPPPSPPRRRWLPLLVTAVAAATATAIAVPLLTGANDDSGNSGGADRSSDISARYVGTWSGPVLRDGTPTGQQRRFVISHGKVGEVVANSTSLGRTYECKSDGKLVSVTAGDGRPALRLDTKVVASVPAGRCSALGEHTLEPGNGNTLKWAAAGRTATLHRLSATAETVPSAYLGTWQRSTANGSSHRLTVKRAPVGSRVLTAVVDGPNGRCTAHADLYSAEGKLTVGPSVIDRAAPGCAPSSPSVFRLHEDGTLRREFLGGDKQPRTYSRAE